MIELATGPARPGAPARVPDPKLVDAARQIEAVFARQLIGAMRAASLGDGLLDTSQGATFRDMADARTADALAAKGGLGLADAIVHQLGGTTGR